jgi:ubiquinone/menaquinone biosynthesis C-methylase UbiE
LSVNHDDHVRLITAALERNRGGVWADFGAGSGAFTLALRDIAGPHAAIIAIDRDGVSLQALRASMERSFPGTQLRLLQGNIAGRLTLPPLDGIVAANAIHYIPQRNHVALLRRWKEYLQPEGRLIVIEYDTERGNTWVPYPMAYTTFQELAPAAGFTEPVLLGVRPSRWLASIYAALTFPIMPSSAVEEWTRGS